MLPLMGKGGIDLSYMLAFQEERSEKNDLVPRLFPFLFQKEKRKRLSVILSVEKREEKKMRSRGFLFLFSFLFFAEEKKKTFVHAMEKGRRVLSFLLFYKDSLWGGFLFSLSSFSFCVNDVMHSSVSSSFFPFFFLNKKPPARRGRGGKTK